MTLRNKPGAARLACPRRHPGLVRAALTGQITAAQAIRKISPCVVTAEPKSSPLLGPPSDVIEAKALIGDKAGLVAKIEKPSALDHIDDILRIADAIMVARGDLGVEIPHQDVPGRKGTGARRASGGEAAAHGQTALGYDEMIAHAAAMACSEKFAAPGDSVVVVFGIPFGKKGTTNNLRVVQVGEA